MSSARWSKFSEAACLYAQNAEVVETMYKEFHREVCAFVDLVRDGVKELLGGKLVESNGESDRTTRHPRVRYWWLEGAQTSLVVETTDYEIITGKRLWLGVNADASVTTAQLAAMRGVASQPVFEEYCEVNREGRIWFMRVIVKLEESDPVPKATEKIASALVALHKAEKAAK